MISPLKRSVSLIFALSTLTLPALAQSSRSTPVDNKNIDISFNAGNSWFRGLGEVQTGLSLMGDVGIGLAENLQMRGLIFTAGGEYRSTANVLTGTQLVDRERMTIFAIGPSYILKRNAVDASIGALIGGAIRSSDYEAFNATTSKVESTSNQSDSRLTAGLSIGFSFNVAGDFLLTARSHYLTTLGGNVSVLSAMGGIGYRF